MHTKFHIPFKESAATSACSAVAFAPGQVRGRPSVCVWRLMQHAEVYVEGLIQDLRYAARKLAGAPAFTLAAVSTLAIGIGATTAIFSTVNATLLRPLPFVHPEEL